MLGERYGIFEEAVVRHRDVDLEMMEAIAERAIHAEIDRRDMAAFANPVLRALGMALPRKPVGAATKTRSLRAAVL
ncbi:MAG: hypothetical protein LM577_00535 [Thermoproteaceae archaeon]|nr:hypothetical protein [Thermoproteaceae archaeon]